MTVARNPIADLCAIAAMPELENLAKVIAPVCKQRTDPVSQIIFLAGQWAVGSRNKLTSMLEHESTWGEMRASAARVGRCLPATPPTQNQLRHVRDRVGEGFGHAVADAFTVAMAPLTRSAVQRLHRSVHAEGTPDSPTRSFMDERGLNRAGPEVPAPKAPRAKR